MAGKISGLFGGHRLLPQYSADVLVDSDSQAQTRSIVAAISLSSYRAYALTVPPLGKISAG
jgi:hypothetical protein